MWKSASSVVASRIGSSGGGKSGCDRHQNKNGRSGLIGQQDQDSIRQLWETAMDGVESSAWEAINEELLARSPTSSISSNTSSSSGSSSPIARQGGKLLQVVKRKVNLSSGTRKEPKSDCASVHDAKDSSPSRNSTTQGGETVSDKVLEELETLRRKLEKKEKEMQELKNEVSTLRITTATRNVRPQSQSQAAATSSQEETSRCDSFDSDSSQSSCLDFSFASSTGNLKFEGKIKTKITPHSDPQAKSGDQPDSTLSDKEVVAAPLLIQQLSQASEVFVPEEVRSTTKGSASSQVQESDILDKLVEATRKRLDECKSGINEPECASRAFLVPEETVEELYISTQSYVYKTKDEFFDNNPNQSRSPPKSASSTEEEDNLEFPRTFSEANNSFVLQKTTSSNVTDFDSASRMSLSDLSDVEDDEKSYRKIMKDGEEVDDNALTVPLSKQTTSNCSPAKEDDSLKVLMKSCVMLEVDKLSNTMTSLRKEESLISSKHPDLISRSTPVLSPRRQRQQSLTAAKDSDLVSGSTSVSSPPRSRPLAAQVYPNRGVYVFRQPLDSAVKAGDFILERPETEEPKSSNRTEVDLASKVLWMSSFEGSMEPITGSDGLDFGNLPLPKSHRRSSYGSTGPQSRRTADRYEGLSPMSPSTSPRGRELPPSSYSAGSQPLWEESVWKPQSGSLEEIDLEEEVRQILEQSRLLLMSDESRNGHGGDVPGPVSRDKPFSVLTLSRQRRSMEKNRTSFRHTPEINQQQERSLQQEEKAIVLYGDVNKWNNVQSSKGDNCPELDAEQENEDISLSRPSKLRNAVDAPHKQDDLQLLWELEVQNSKNQIMSSLPRRSRFFFEANHAWTSGVV